MAGCSLSKGRGYFCAGSVGGIKKVYLAYYHGAEAITKVETDSTTNFGRVTDVTTKAGGSLEFFEFDLDRQMSSFNQTILTGKGGAVAYQTELELHMSHDSEESWMRMQEVAEGLFQVFVEDNNGVFYLAGVENGIECTGGSYAHGGDVAYTDYVGYVVNLTGAEPLPAFNFGSTTSPFQAYTSGTLTLSASQYNTPQV
jgi:hypothetical protein